MCKGKDDSQSAGSEDAVAAERRWFNQGTEFLTFEEFRACPMGVDILAGDDAEANEAELKRRWEQLPTEAEMMKRAGAWDLQEMADTEKPWELLSMMEKVEAVIIGFTKFVAIWCVLYLFIISLGVMGDAFKILGGRSSGRAFREADLLANPVAGLAIGVLATVLMQSSSTTTSIVISMAAADLVTVKNAAYLVMGANIGTSVTNTIVSIAHLNSPAEYRRAFTGAVFHDMFNWLTVGVFLPLEATSGFLVELAGAAVDSMGISNDDKRGKVEFIKKITKPAGGRVVSTDKKLIEKIAQAETEAKVKELEKETIIKQSSGHVLRDTPISDDEAGVLLLFVSLTMLATCLLLLVKLLQSVLKGKVAKWTRTLLNLDFKHPILRSCGGLDNYILLLFGTGCTILVQSSSVFTSTLTPLVGIGLIHVEKAVSLTHGANIGTTVTGVLSALSGSNLDKGMRVALEHVFFNSLGTVLWFVVWPLRPVPLNMAKFMGETAANLRLFPLVYIIFCFLLMPLLIIGLSIPGWEVLLGVMGPLFVLAMLGTAWVLLRRNRADLLPRSMPILRAEEAPCGCRYPNFMQLWGGDLEKDQVDIAELRQKAEEEERKLRAAREWPYSPAGWGLALLAFLGAVLALPTSQWQRVRYAKEARGRKEVGLGLWEVCSEAYEKEHSLMAVPTYPCVNGGNGAMEECAKELSAACRDEAWAGNAADEGQQKREAFLYERVFERCSKFGCRAHAWVDACTALPACADKPRHSSLCRAPVSTYKWYNTVDPDVHGVELRWATPDKADVKDDKVAHDPGLHEEGDKEQSAKAFPQRVSYAGLVFDQCSGHVHMLTTRGCDVTDGFAGPELVEAELAITTTAADTVREVQVVQSVKVGSATGMPPAADVAVQVEASCPVAGSVVDAADVSPRGLALGDVDLLGTRDGKKVYLAADAYAPKLVAFDEAGRVVATYAVEGAAHPEDAAVHGKVVKVLPKVFQFGRLRAVAVSAKSDGKTKAVACLAKPATAGQAALAMSRVVRCVVLDVTDMEAPSVLSQQVVLMQDKGAEQDKLELVSGSWLSDDKVLFVQRFVNNGTNASEASALEVDFGSSSGAADLQAQKFAEYNNVDDNAPEGWPRALSLEALAVDLAAAPVVPKMDATRVLFMAEVVPARMRRVLDLALGDVAAHRVSGLAVLNGATVAVVEAGATEANGDALRAHVLQVPADVELEPKKQSCAKTKVAKFAKGEKCRDISEICPEGDLAGDMETVGGLAVSGTLFLGIGTVCIIAYSLAMHHPVMGKLHYVAAGTLLLAWILLCAAWGHMDQLTQNRYGCYFEDEALRKGMVLHYGKLEHLMMPSYSWGFCIYAWGLLTISMSFVLYRVADLIVHPHHSGMGQEVKETEPAA